MTIDRFTFRFSAAFSEEAQKPRSALIGLSAFLLFSLFSFVGCSMRAWIFFPEKQIGATPADIGLAFEDLSLAASDGVRINGWFVPAANARTTLLLLHGNGGNLSHRVELLRRLHRIELNVFMIDYRGYGKSEGKVSEEGTYRDALAAYDYLLTRTDVDPGRIVVFGQSLGAGVAVELATQRRVAGLILEAPFTSIREMAKAVVPWLPVGGLVSTRYDNLAKIKNIGTPLLILHGDQDEVVPYAQGRRLFEAANEPKRFYTIVGAGHNNTYRVGKEEYDEAIKGFIEEVEKR